MRGLLRHSWIYSLAPVFQRLLSIALIRLYTARLSTAEFGVLELLDLLLLLVPQLVGLNLLGGLTRFYFEHTDPKRRAQVVSSTTLVLGVAAFAVTGLLLAWRAPLAGAFFATGTSATAPEPLIDAFTLAVLIVPFALCTVSGLRYLQILKRSRASTTIQVAKTVVEAALKLWFLFGLGWGVHGFLLGILIGEVLTAACLVVWMFALLRTGFEWTVFRPVLLFSLPLVPLGLVQLGLHYFARLLLEHLGPHAPSASATDLQSTVAREWVGVYALGAKIGQLLNAAALAPFMQIWQPHVFGLPAGARRAELVRLGNWALAALCAMYLPIAIFGRQAVDVLSGSPEFREAWRVAPIAILAYLAYGSYSMSQVSLLVDKRSGALLAVNLLALAVGVALGAVLVANAGEHGYALAALALLVSFTVLAFGTERTAAARGGRTRDHSASMRLGGIAVAAVAAALAVDAWRDPLDGFLAVALALKSAILVATLAALWRLGLDAEGRAGLVRLGTDLVARARSR